MQVAVEPMRLSADLNRHPSRLVYYRAAIVFQNNLNREQYPVPEHSIDHYPHISSLPIRTGSIHRPRILNLDNPTFNHPPDFPLRSNNIHPPPRRLSARESHGRLREKHKTPRSLHTPRGRQQHPPPNPLSRTYNDNPSRMLPGPICGDNPLNLLRINPRIRQELILKQPR